MTQSTQHPVCSIIVPTYNEAMNIGSLLDSLLQQKEPAEIIVVDGGSDDETIDIVQEYPQVTLLRSAKGRAIQMNQGADHANFSPLVFLHADTIIPSNFITEAQKVEQEDWGYFYTEIDSKRPVFRVIEFMMNHRSRLTSVITGDMAITVGSELFQKSGKYAQIKLMEDIELSKRLRKKRHPCRANATVRTSPRRWQKHGVFKTILLMWRLRLGYFLGMNIERLIIKYV